MKGFVITILSVSLIVILVVLVMTFRNAQLSIERALIEPLPLTYAAFLLDDVGYEFNTIVGPEITIDQRNDSIGITIIDKLHNYNHSPEIEGYGSFLSGEVAGRTASNISANFTNLTAGSIRLFINEDYIYSNNHTNNESIFIREGGTGATSYEINLTLRAVRAGVNNNLVFNDSGTLNITIRYTDLNGTTIVQGTIFPNQVNILNINYANGGSVLISIGPENGQDGSLRMKTTSIEADVSWFAVLPPINETKKLGYEYDATIGYVQGPVSKHAKIGK